MVIDLYRQTFTDYVKSNQVNNDRILEVQTAIENAMYDEFQRVYEQIKAEYTIEINDSVWGDIVIGDITYEPITE